MNKKTIQAICIVVSYVVMYGLLALFMNVFSNNSVAFLVFAVICAFFSYKSTKGFLTNTLSSLPWPAFLVLLIFSTLIVGVIVAPYHIGKWVSEKIPVTTEPIHNPPQRKTSSPAPISSFQKTLNSVGSFSDAELEKMHQELLQYVREIPSPVPLPGVPDNRDHKSEWKDFIKKPLPNGPIYDCVTYGNAQELNRAIVAEQDKRES